MMKVSESLEFWNGVDIKLTVIYCQMIFLSHNVKIKVTSGMTVGSHLSVHLVWLYQTSPIYVGTEHAWTLTRVLLIQTLGQPACLPLRIFTLYSFIVYVKEASLISYLMSWVILLKYVLCLLPVCVLCVFVLFLAYGAAEISSPDASLTKIMYCHDSIKYFARLLTSGLLFFLLLFLSLYIPHAMSKCDFELQ